MPRLHDWPERLEAYLAEAAARRFEYGAHDCARFAAGAVHAMTGADPMPGFRYKTAAGAARAIKRAGGLVAAMRARFAEIPPAMAGRGDIGLVATPDGLALVIVLADRIAGAAPIGFASGQRSQLLHAFRV